MTGVEVEIIQGFIDGLKPEVRLTVSEWAARNRRMTSAETSKPGPWNNNFTPYLVEIMDNLSITNDIRKVVVMKGAQLGFTETGNNLIGYCIDQAPTKIMMVQPTDGMAKQMSKMRITPMIDNTPALSAKVKPARSRDSGNTTMLKQFPGGAFILTGANSAVGLRMIAARVLIQDELDGWPHDLDGEGNPSDISEARTRTYGRRAKVYKLSTPTIDGQSHIQGEFLKTDQRYYYMPCPHCRHEQDFKFAQLKWEPGNHDEVWYECIKCKGKIDEAYKADMMINGHWQVTCPENVSPTRVGYHLNSLYSPREWFSWKDIAKQWEEAQGDVNKLKVFANTVLGECWVERGDSPKWETVYNKRRDYKYNTITDDVYFITAGVDVQADRLEVEIVGWGKGKRSWSIDYRQLIGDTSQEAVWMQLAGILSEHWQRPDGVMLPVLVMAVDSGYNTHTVYEFCRASGGRAVPVKGQDTLMTPLGQPKSVDINYEGKKVGIIKLWNIGVTLIKKELYGYLNLQLIDGQPAPAGYCFFPQYAEWYFKGLTAESYTYKVSKNGRKKWAWTKTYERNEPLDCRVYARAGAAIVGIDWFIDENYDGVLNTFNSAQNDDDQTPQPKKRKDDYWN